MPQATEVSIVAFGVSQGVTETQVGGYLESLVDSFGQNATLARHHVFN